MHVTLLPIDDKCGRIDYSHDVGVTNVQIFTPRIKQYSTYTKTVET